MAADGNINKYSTSRGQEQMKRAITEMVSEKGLSLVNANPDGFAN